MKLNEIITIVSESELSEPKITKLPYIEPDKKRKAFDRGGRLFSGVGPHKGAKNAARGIPAKSTERQSLNTIPGARQKEANK